MALRTPTTGTGSLDARQAAILEAVIRHYVLSAQPVASQAIAANDGIGVSSATVRNEMAVLEERGLIEQPHTSAGRVPTERGYRWYVDHMRGTRGLSVVQRRAISYFFASPHSSVCELLAETSHLLARVTDHAGVVVAPAADAASVCSFHLTPLDSGTAVAVAVMSDGSVERELLGLDDAVDATRVQAAEEILSDALTSHPLSAHGSPRVTGDTLIDGVVDTAVAAIRRHVRESSEPCFVGGAGRIAAEQDAFGSSDLAELLDVLERPSLLATITRDALDRGMTVQIGSENDLSELRECSMVLASYPVGLAASGTVAVLGPTRMDYATALGAVAHVARQLTDAVADLDLAAGSGT
ncbi:MAG: heat-inducible transcriptional repressor HrcA [Acidimicrobiia bacterium]|nr:heat-inducible transcriptional repressor HrcA [Acidimicrobiia bacterium]